MKSKRAERDALIENHKDFVGTVVGRMVRSMHLPASMFDEFVSAGYLGLVEAAERYNKLHGVAFKAWAAIRIRGAVIDAIRNSSAISGKAYRSLRRLEAIDNLRSEMLEQHETSAHPDDQALRLARLLDFAAKGALIFRLSIADCENEITGAQDSRIDPESRLIRAQENRKVCSLVETLPKKERLVIKRLYFSGKSISEIASAKNGMSKSWVCRLHQRGIKLLKQRYLELEANPQRFTLKPAVRSRRLPRANCPRTRRERSQSSAKQASGNRDPIR